MSAPHTGLPLYRSTASRSKPAVQNYSSISKTMAIMISRYVYTFNISIIAYERTVTVTGVMHLLYLPCALCIQIQEKNISMLRNVTYMFYIGEKKEKKKQYTHY